jgi:hypothetical protein
MAQAVGTIEMSATFYHITWLNMPEDNRLHTHRREKLKSQQK